MRDNDILPYSEADHVLFMVKTAMKNLSKLNSSKSTNQEEIWCMINSSNPEIKNIYGPSFFENLSEIIEANLSQIKDIIESNIDEGRKGIIENKEKEIADLKLSQTKE